MSHDEEVECPQLSDCAWDLLVRTVLRCVVDGTRHEQPVYEGEEICAALDLEHGALVEVRGGASLPWFLWPTAAGEAAVAELMGIQGMR